MQISVCETQVKILIIQSNLYIFDVARLLFLYYFFLLVYTVYQKLLTLNHVCWSFLKM